MAAAGLDTYSCATSALLHAPVFVTVNVTVALVVAVTAPELASFV
jgi:hypothetical protein